MSTRPLLRTSVIVVAGLALVLGACRSSNKPESVAVATGTVRAPGADTPAAAVATAQARAIGQPQNGTLPVWLTSFAVLPWVNHIDQAGRYTFTVSNRSASKHSFAIIQFDGDPRSLPRSANLIATTQVKVIAQTDVIEAGREIDLTVELPVGRYVLTSLFAQDYTDGMAAAFSVGQSNGAPIPKQPAEGALGVYLLEYGAFVSNGQVRSGKTTLNVQNLGSKARDFAIVRWRGTEDALPVDHGTILLDGLQEVHRFDTLSAGEERQVEVNLSGGFSYVIVSLVKDEYDRGVHAQIKVN